LDAGTGEHQESRVERAALFLEPSAWPVKELSASLGISEWEAQQWRARNGYRLVRVGAAPEVEKTAASLGGRSRTALVVPESWARPSHDPIRLEVVLDEPAARLLLVENAAGAPVERVIEPHHVLLVVLGPIARRKVRDEAKKNQPAASPMDERTVVHLHLHDGPRPIEIDPIHARFAGGGRGSAALRILALGRRLGLSGVVDEDFRFEVPAFSEAEESQLRLDTRSGAPRDGAKKGAAGVKIHDNLAQFRAYSGWRGARARLDRAEVRQAS
jgi:hypothetical protein